MMDSKYKQIFENSKEGLLVANKSGTIEMVNPQVVKLFGYQSKEELLGQKIEILIPHELRKHHVNHRDNYSKNPTSRSMGIGKNLSAVRKDGSSFPVEVSLSHFKENDELKVIAFIVDITERVKIEAEVLKLNTELEREVQFRTAEINAQNKLLRSIAENFPNGNIYVVNDNFIIEWADGSLIREMGLTDQSLIGLSFKNRLPEKDKNAIIIELEKLIAGQSIRYDLTDKNRHFTIHGVPLDLSLNANKRALLVELDVTSQRKAELEMQDNLNKEKELNEMKSRFVSMASHEFRTPLSTIISSATIIGKYPEATQQSQREKHIERIKRSVFNLTGILNDFLSLDKLESGAATFKNQPINLYGFTQELNEEFSAIKKENQTLITDFKFEFDTINCDPVILKNCCLNLLSNATKYSKDDDFIDFTMYTSKTEFLTQVKDYGIGIPKDEQKELFSRFFRAKNVTNIQGTGLGLNIVKRYVDLMGGSITFESEVNSGTTFTIRIPIANMLKPIE